MNFSTVGEALLLCGILLFILGTAGFLSGHLAQEHLSSFTALGLIFSGAGAGLKRKG